MERAALGVEGGDDDEGVEGEDHEGVDEHADHGDDALLVGILDVGLRVGVRRGAHTGLIGEQAALRALGERDLQRRAEAAADDGLRSEGIPEDHAEGRGDVLDAGDEDDQSAGQENSRHDGHDLLGHGGEALHAAEEDEAADGDEHHADDPRRHVEGVGEGLADGVGLHHAAEEAERQNDGDGEEAREELAEAALEGGGDIVNRAAEDVAVLIHGARFLRERGFRVDGRHAEEGDDPHPEDGAGAAGEDRAGRADDIAGADLRRNGGGERLEGAHAALLLSAAETEAAEHAVPALLEVTDLHEAGLDGVPQTNGDEQRDQNVVGQVAVDLLHNGEKCFSHGKFPPKNIVPRFSSSSRFADKAKNRAAEEIDSPDPSSHP